MSGRGLASERLLAKVRLAGYWRYESDNIYYVNYQLILISEFPQYFLKSSYDFTSFDVRLPEIQLKPKALFLSLIFVDIRFSLGRPPPFGGLPQFGPRGAARTGNLFNKGDHRLMARLTCNRNQN